MKETFEIANFCIGKNRAPFIVAEAGINHNGEIEKAFEMIRVAKLAGADCVKFQTFKAREFVSDQKQQYTYRSQGKECTESMLEMFERHEFSKDQWKQIKRECDKQQILFLSTPQNPSDLEILLELGVEAIKVGSDDLTHLPLLETYSKTQLPIFLSCGMADLAEIHQALRTVGTFDGYPTVLLLCTSQYPTPPKDIHLRKLETLSGAFPGLPLGFSDHSQGPLASSLALAMGACVFEKHFTLDHDLPGPDHWFSDDPIGLKEWVNAIRTAHQMMGSPFVRPTAEEEKMRTLARRSLVALEEIQIGDLLNERNIGFRRPGNGLNPQWFSRIAGCKAARKIEKNSMLQLGDFVR